MSSAHAEPSAVRATPPSKREFARLTVLNVLATLTVPLAGLVDTAMLGHLRVGTALAGAAVGALVFDYLFWGFGFLRMATTGLAAGAMGRADVSEVHALLWRAAGMGFAIGSGWALLAPAVVALAGFLPGDAAVVEQAQAYVGARLWGAPATMANFAWVGWLLGTGRSARALLLASVANLSNAGFNAWFIWGLGWEAAGAGYATACGQWLALVVIVLATPRFSFERPSRAAVLERPKLRQLFALGGDITIRTVCLVTAMSLFTGAAARWGAAVLAGQAVLIRLLGVFSYVIDGAAQAVEALAGRVHAAGRPEEVLRVVRWGYMVSVGVVLLLGTVLLGHPRAALLLLTDIEDVLKHAVRWLPWTLTVAFFGGFAYILDGLFIGTARGRDLRNAMLWSFFGVFVPGFGLALWIDSLRVLWGAMAMFMVARAVSLAIVWRRSAPACGTRAA